MMQANKGRAWCPATYAPPQKLIKVAGTGFTDIQLEGRERKDKKIEYLWSEI